MNHSCEPNAEVRFEDAGPGAGVVAAVHALREIRVGEELRHSYVDETRPVFLRAADLAAFGFRCDCGKVRASARRVVMRLRDDAGCADLGKSTRSLLFFQTSKR